MRKGRGTKVPPVPNKRQMESPELSAVDQASFFEGLEQNDSNPLHSTALEEQMSVKDEGRLDKKQGQRGTVPPDKKQGQRGTVPPDKKQRAAVRRKESGGGEAEGKKRRTDAEEGAKQQKGGVQGKPDQKAGKSNPIRTPPKAERRLSGKKASGKMSAGRPAQKRQRAENQRARESSDEKIEESEEESDPDGAQKNRRRLLSSDEGSVWKPSPKRNKRLNLGRNSSSGSSSEDAKGAGSSRQDKSRRVVRGGSQLDVVLDAFLDFCRQYGETVESAAVRESIGRFSENVKAQLVEKISSLKELSCLKRQNAKVSSMIHGKTQRLLNAKHELMRAERQVWLLEKEKAELQQRVADLRRGQAFLRDVRELTSRYLVHRRKHPAEKETFGASSLPALLLETKLLQKPGRQGRARNQTERESQNIMSYSFA